MQLTLTPELILHAYSMGIFPMADEEGQICWYSPDPRCIIDLKCFHASHRLMRTYRSGVFEIKINSAWTEVLRHCADRPITWIDEDIDHTYTQLHQMGFAHSVEAYKNGVLAGGLYGVSLGGAFMGESMFHLVTDASKVCLVALVERLRERGYVLLDVQYISPHLERFAANKIPRAQYLELLGQALKLSCCFN